jgi:hypothetical protein
MSTFRRVLFTRFGLFCACVFIGSIILFIMGIEYTIKYQSINDKLISGTIYNTNPCSISNTNYNLTCYFSCDINSSIILINNKCIIYMDNNILNLVYGILCQILGGIILNVIVDLFKKRMKNIENINII